MTLLKHFKIIMLSKFSKLEMQNFFYEYMQNSITKRYCTSTVYLSTSNNDSLENFINFIKIE